MFCVLFINYFFAENSGPGNNRLHCGTNQKVKWLHLRLHNTYTRCFWYGKGHCQCLLPYQNQVRGLCTGGDITILILGSFHNLACYCTDPKILKKTLEPNKKWQFAEFYKYYTSNTTSVR